ncbi:MAG: hypothetical protein R2695_11200 [Acidimicrobiales bacterium]
MGFRRGRPGPYGPRPDRRHPPGPRSAGLGIGDDLWRSNEAFAPMCVATCKVLDIDDDLFVNVVGSGCSLGHLIARPVPAWSSRRIHELGRRGGAPSPPCAGGGMSTAVVLEVPAAG